MRYENLEKAADLARRLGEIENKLLLIEETSNPRCPNINICVKDDAYLTLNDLCRHPEIYGVSSGRVMSAIRASVLDQMKEHREIMGEEISKLGVVFDEQPVADRPGKGEE